MADCSYSRCIQQRRNIKRELQRWTKNMVYIVGLERIAEDLMGKRKWKLYQDSMQQRNYLQPLNNNVKSTTTTTTTTQSEEEDEAVATATATTKQQFGKEAGGGGGGSTTTSPAPEAAAVAGDEQQQQQQPAANGVDNHNHHHHTATTTTAVAVVDEEDEHNDCGAGDDVYKVKDWSPTSKCMFCVDGKLDEHNNHGALSPRPSDSESSDAASDVETAPTLTPSAATLLGNHHLNHLHQRRTSATNMTALETQMVAMAAALSGAGGGGGAPGAGSVAAGVGGAPHHLPPSVYYGGPLGPSWLLSQISSLQQAAAQAAAAAAADEKQPAGAGGEQPLDLSSKAGSGDSTPTDTPRHNPNRLSTLDNKHLFNSDFRAKPRMSAVGGGRRTYTEEELQAALRDIQSGKLGTRRAAVIYGIPRSTLRNKVYKLALERERDAHLTSAASLKEEDEAAAASSATDMDMDDKELSGAEEEKEVEKALEGPLLSYDDLLTSDPLKALLTKQLGGGAGVGGGGGVGAGGDGGGGCGSDDEQQQHQQQTAAAHFQALLLRSLISSKVLDGSGFLNDQLKLQLAAHAHSANQSNGDHLGRERPSPSNSVIHRAGSGGGGGGGGGSGGVKRDRPDSDSETEDSGSNVILKIPSFKPTTPGSKNGGGGGGGGAGSVGGDYCPGSMASPSVTSDSTSPPIALPLPGRGLYQKDVKELIAKSISQKFQHDPEPPSSAAQHTAPPTAMRNPMLDFDLSRNRGRFTPPLGAGISVIKTQGQEPRVPYQGHHQGQPHHQHHGPPHGHHHGAHAPNQNQKSHNSNVGGATGNSSGGGKGTRPKRGKYRNYDRDSLVEAVRAVQRGEMSVHRAGSYYGVPHSTLEYKVKERHLMRPRKRDPKPNPVDEKIASLKQNDLRNAAAAAAAANEKMKAAAGIKPGGGAKFAPASPNGIKLPMYDPALGSIGYNAHPFPFWPHPYPHIPLEYGRSSASAAAAAAAFPATNPEQLYASQMIQKLHEESRFINAPPGGGGGGPGGGPTAPGANLSKSTRQMAESLLDPTESNGLLDGIIRSSLESGVPGDDKKEDGNVKPQNMSNKTLLDQLCRNSRLAPLTKFTSADPDGRRKENGDSDVSVDQQDEVMEYKPDITTIELSNDSSDGKARNNGAPSSGSGENGKQDSGAHTPRPGMIYLKQELTKPENLKPEMLVRFRDALAGVEATATQRNGVDDVSASESETHD